MENKKNKELEMTASSATEKLSNAEEQFKSAKEQARSGQGNVSSIAPHQQHGRKHYTSYEDQQALTLSTVTTPATRDAISSARATSSSAPRAGPAIRRAASYS